MSGNAAEWCLDLYNKYNISEQNDPLCTKSKYKERVIRGGHFFSSPKNVRCSYRDARDPNTKNYEFGFRVVKNIDK